MIHEKTSAGNRAAALGFCVLALGFALAFTACDGNGDEDDVKDIVAKAKHLLGGTIGDGASAKTFFADKKASSPSSSLRAAVTSSELEGKIEDGDFAITLKGTYDETSGSFMLGAVSETLKIGYQISGFLKGDDAKNVKAVVKAKNANGEWTETEVKVNFNKEAEVSATQTDNGAAGLPASWSGRYQIPVLMKPGLIQQIDEAFGFTYDAPDDQDKGPGAALADYFFFAVAPMGLSLVVDYDGVDAKITELAQQGDPKPTAEQLKELKKEIHKTMAVVVENAYYSFLEVTQGNASKPEIVGTTAGTENPAAYYVLVYTMSQVGQSDAAGTNDNPPQFVKLYSRLKITESNGALTLIQAQDLSYDEEITFNKWEYDEFGLLVESNKPETVTCQVNGASKDAAAARAAKNFTSTYSYTENGQNKTIDISLVLTK